MIVQNRTSNVEIARENTKTSEKNLNNLFDNIMKNQLKASKKDQSLIKKNEEENTEQVVDISALFVVPTVDFNNAEVPTITLDVSMIDSENLQQSNPLDLLANQEILNAQSQINQVQNFDVLNQQLQTAQVLEIQPQTPQILSEQTVEVNNIFNNQLQMQQPKMQDDATIKELDLDVQTQAPQIVDAIKDVDTTENANQQPLLNADKNEQTDEPVLSQPVQIQTKLATLDTEMVNIKVADAPQVDTAQFIDDISDKISVKINEGIQEFNMELNPQELGKINIKITFSAQQALVSLTASNSKTQDLLLANSNEIKSIIQSNLGQETIVTVQENSDVGQYRDNADLQQESQNKKNPYEDYQFIDQDESVDFLNKLRLGLAQSI